MRIEVTQVVPGYADIWNEINTDMVERVHETAPNSGLTIDFGSGKSISIRENRTWWRQHALQKD